jgi:DNA-directed RNA polymerase subunit RPC12/RpoP
MQAEKNSLINTSSTDFGYHELAKLGSLITKPEHKFKIPQQPQKTILLRCRKCRYTFMITTNAEYIRCHNCNRKIHVINDRFNVEASLKHQNNRRRKGF